MLDSCWPAIRVYVSPSTPKADGINANRVLCHVGLFSAMFNWEGTVKRHDLNNKWIAINTQGMISFMYSCRNNHWVQVFVLLPGVQYVLEQCDLSIKAIDILIDLIDWLRIMFVVKFLWLIMTQIKYAVFIIIRSSPFNDNNRMFDTWWYSFHV